MVFLSYSPTQYQNIRMISSKLTVVVLLAFALIMPSESFGVLPVLRTSSLHSSQSILYSSAQSIDHPNVQSLSPGAHIRTADVFSLDSIRSTLIRQEETIIFALIERAQYRTNDNIYQPNVLNFKEDNQSQSFFDWMLLETEKLHAQVRRYTSPEEHPFNPESIPQQLSGLPKLNYPSLLGTEKEKVNVNNVIKQRYVSNVIPKLCLAGDDEQYGSSVMADIAALQAISRRVHYGKFVAESKFLKQGDLFTEYINRGEVFRIIELLTNVDVERRVLRRAFVKASTYGQDISYGSNNIDSSKVAYKVDPALIVEIYRDMIVPLTKDVEVKYLYHRVGKEPPPSHTYISACRGPLDAFDDPNCFKQMGI